MGRPCDCCGEKKCYCCELPVPNYDGDCKYAVGMIIWNPSGKPSSNWDIAIGHDVGVKSANADISVEFNAPHYNGEGNNRHYNPHWIGLDFPGGCSAPDADEIANIIPYLNGDEGMIVEDAGDASWPSLLEWVEIPIYTPEITKTVYKDGLAEEVVTQEKSCKFGEVISNDDASNLVGKLVKRLSDGLKYKITSVRNRDNQGRQHYYIRKVNDDGSMGGPVDVVENEIVDWETGETIRAPGPKSTKRWYAKKNLRLRWDRTAVACHPDAEDPNNPGEYLEKWGHFGTDLEVRIVCLKKATQDEKPDLSEGCESSGDSSSSDSWMNWNVCASTYDFFCNQESPWWDYGYYGEQRNHKTYPGVKKIEAGKWYITGTFAKCNVSGNFPACDYREALAEQSPINSCQNTCNSTEAPSCGDATVNNAYSAYYGYWSECYQEQQEDMMRTAFALPDEDAWREMLATGGYLRLPDGVWVNQGRGVYSSPNFCGPPYDGWDVYLWGASAAWLSNNVLSNGGLNSCCHGTGSPRRTVCWVDYCKKNVTPPEGSYYGQWMTSCGYGAFWGWSCRCDTVASKIKTRSYTSNCCERDAGWSIYGGKSWFNAEDNTWSSEPNCKVNMSDEELMWCCNLGGCCSGSYNPFFGGFESLGTYDWMYADKPCVENPPGGSKEGCYCNWEDIEEGNWRSNTITQWVPVDCDALDTDDPACCGPHNNFCGWSSPSLVNCGCWVEQALTDDPWNVDIGNCDDCDPIMTEGDDGATRREWPCCPDCTPPEEPPPPPPPYLTYDCVIDSYTGYYACVQADPRTPDAGEYATLEECEENCEESYTLTWRCNSEGNCEEGNWGDLESYDSQQECQVFCSEGMTSWECTADEGTEDAICIQIDGPGDFVSEQECMNFCAGDGQVMYECIDAQGVGGNNRICVEVVGGRMTLEECEEVCQNNLPPNPDPPTGPDRWSCISGSCVQAEDGEYPDHLECLLGCGGDTPPPDDPEDDDPDVPEDDDDDPYDPDTPPDRPDTDPPDTDVPDGIPDVPPSNEEELETRDTEEGDLLPGEGDGGLVVESPPGGSAPKGFPEPDMSGGWPPAHQSENPPEIAGGGASHAPMPTPVNPNKPAVAAPVPVKDPLGRQVKWIKEQAEKNRAGSVEDWEDTPGSLDDDDILIAPEDLEAEEEVEDELKMGDIGFNPSDIPGFRNDARRRVYPDRVQPTDPIDIYGPFSPPVPEYRPNPNEFPSNQQIPEVTSPPNPIPRVPLPPSGARIPNLPEPITPRGIPSEYAGLNIPKGDVSDGTWENIDVMGGRQVTTRPEEEEIIVFTAAPTTGEAPTEITTPVGTPVTPTPDPSDDDSVTTWNCSGSPDYNCVEVSGLGGTYSSLSACESDCSAPADCGTGESGAESYCVYMWTNCTGMDEYGSPTGCSWQLYASDCPCSCSLSDTSAGSEAGELRNGTCS